MESDIVPVKIYICTWATIDIEVNEFQNDLDYLNFSYAY